MASAADIDVSDVSDVSAEESKKSKDLDGEGMRPARDTAPAPADPGLSACVEGEPKSSPTEGGSTGRGGSDGTPFDRETTRPGEDTEASTGRDDEASPVHAAAGWEEDVAALLDGDVAGRCGIAGTSPDTRSRARDDEASPEGEAVGRGGSDSEPSGCEAVRRDEDNGLSSDGRSFCRGNEVSLEGEATGLGGSDTMPPDIGSHVGRGGT
ncbi:hypothetical protein [Streptomyces sp. R41]|uniref:Uncharacterized protein n=1 Tax=Streptomyces sp. R41 TaxID=3238632 RepID=A0AB39RGJ1_9ACTN